MAIDDIGSSTDIMLGTTRSYDAVFTDKADNSTIKPSDFLNLMIAQMRNQDFLNPMDDTQFVTQMAQFSTMQQMMELAEYSKTNYAMSLVGKTVTAARFNVSGGLVSTTGVVKKIALYDNDFYLYIGDDDERYTLSQIMEVAATPDKGVSGTNETGKTDGTDEADGAKSKVDTSGITLAPGVMTMDTAVIVWQAPTSDAKLADQLTYTVYYSKEGPFDTLALVKAGTVGQAEQTGVKVGVIPGLEPGTQYFLNVVVKDPDGVESIFKPVTVTTATSIGFPGGTTPEDGEETPGVDEEDEVPAAEEAAGAEETPGIGEGEETPGVGDEEETPAAEEAVGTEEDIPEESN